MIILKIDQTTEMVAAGHVFSDKNDTRFYCEYYLWLRAVPTKRIYYVDDIRPGDGTVMFVTTMRAL